jgi:DNA-binding transcriptional ArsR family regulator
MKHEKEVFDPETGELIKRNANFVQFYQDNLQLLGRMSAENPTALRILLWLIRLMDDRNAVVTSQVAISEALKLHRNTVSNAVSYLKANKAIAVLKSGTTNVYAINEQIAWKEDADFKRYAHFSAKVYLVGSEQEEDFQQTMFGHATRRVRKASSSKLRTSKPSEFAPSDEVHI